MFMPGVWNLLSKKENGNTFTLFIIFIVKSLQKEQNSTNLLLWPPICRNKSAITPKWFNSLDTNSSQPLCNWSKMSVDHKLVDKWWCFAMMQFDYFFSVLRWCLVSLRVTRVELIASCIKNNAKFPCNWGL